jgi:hypothetical protein
VLELLILVLETIVLVLDVNDRLLINLIIILPLIKIDGLILHTLKLVLKSGLYSAYLLYLISQVLVLVQ